MRRQYTRRPVVEIDGCWLWTGANDGKRGYGRIRAGDKYVPAHRKAWEDATGETLTPADVICHTCDTPACVRADDIGTYDIDGVSYPRRGHLVKSTNRANQRDKATKGRQASGDRQGLRAHPDRAPMGERNRHAKLTEAQVIEIRRRYAAGGVSQSQLGREYGLIQSAISAVVLRKHWKHLP